MGVSSSVGIFPTAGITHNHLHQKGQDLGSGYTHVVDKGAVVTP